MTATFYGIPGLIVILITVIYLFKNIGRSKEIENFWMKILLGFLIGGWILVLEPIIRQWISVG